VTNGATAKLVGILAVFTVGMFLLLPRLVFDVTHRVGELMTLPPMSPRQFALVDSVRYVRDANHACWAVTPSDSLPTGGR
jgi:hypothetical protein